MADSKNKEVEADGDDKDDGGSIAGSETVGKIVNAHLVYKSQAIRFAKNTQYQRAARAFTLALEEAPQNKETLVLRSQCYLFLGDLFSARADIDAALQQDPKYVSALYWKAEILFHQSEFEESLIFFHRGRKMRPDEQRFRLGAQKTEQAMIACLEKSGMELEARGKLEIFYKSIPDSRPKKSNDESAMNLDQQLNQNQNQARRDIKQNAVAGSVAGQEPDEIELLQANTQSGADATNAAAAALGAGGQQQTLHVKHHHRHNKADDDLDAHAEESKQARRQRRREANRRKQSDKLRAVVLGDLNKDRKLMEKILEGNGYVLPINETFRPHNEDIEHEGKFILDYLDQRQQFWLQRNPFIITQNIKRDENLDGDADDVNFSLESDGAKQQHAAAMAVAK